MSAVSEPITLASEPSRKGGATALSLRYALRELRGGLRGFYVFIGFVFQQFNLLAYLNAWRNVELPLIYRGVDPDERHARAVGALDRVGLGDRIEHRPGELSGGQQQRVAIARALVTEPTMLLADEPTGNLDSRSSADVLGFLSDLHADGNTIVLITHERDVSEHADRIIQIRDGEIASDARSQRAGVDG